MAAGCFHGNAEVGAGQSFPRLPPEEHLKSESAAAPETAKQMQAEVPATV
jgi:hypothetical protein